jgi:uncharacterized protein (DUF1697 family)
MTRYAAFLRGVMPMNVNMPQLKKAFEAAGFTEVKTVLGSGNVVFNAPSKSTASLERKAEAAMTEELGKSFFTIVRSVDELREILSHDPYRGFGIPADAKRIVTFLRDRHSPQLKLPIELQGAQILSTNGREVFSAYLPTPKGPVFMSLIEKTFGKEQTTRTWETVKKVAG